MVVDVDQMKRLAANGAAVGFASPFPEASIVQSVSADVNDGYPVVFVIVIVVVIGRRSAGLSGEVDGEDGRWYEGANWRVGGRAGLGVGYRVLVLLLL